MITRVLAGGIYMSSSGFSLAADVIAVHGERGDSTAKARPQSGVRKRYRSLPASSFLLSYAAAEVEVKDSNKAQEFVSNGRAQGIHWPELVASWDACGLPLVARARMVPQPGARSGFHRWTLLGGGRLSDYLGDASRIRNQLAHRASTVGIPLYSGVFAPVGGELKSMTLMLAEGFLQAAQDISFQLRSQLQADLDQWEWALPERSSASRMPRALHRHVAFPLPE